MIELSWLSDRSFSVRNHQVAPQWRVTGRQNGAESVVQAFG
jgi:hypothetical protein